MRQRTYEKFVSNLKASHQIVIKVAVYLLQKGLSLHVPPLYITPDKKHRYDYVDEGDIILLDENGYNGRFEVKQYKKEDFKSNMDFEKEYILVDEVYKADKEEPLIGYFIVNASATGFIWIPASSAKFWFEVFVREYDDKNGHYTFAIDKRRVKYYELD